MLTTEVPRLRLLERMAANLVCDSSIILSAVPRLVKRHIIPGLQLNPRIVIIFFWRAGCQAERSAEPLNLKRLHLDADMLDRTKFSEPLLKPGRPVNWWSCGWRQ